MLPRLVILMLLAAVCTAQETAPLKRAITIPERSPVIIELDKRLTSADSKIGTVIEFHTVRQVEIDGATVIVGGNHLTATIVKAKSAGSWKRDGNLEIELGTVTAVDGSPVHLRFPMREPEKKLSAKGKTALAIQAPIAGLFALYFFPQTLFLVASESKKGMELIVPAGERFEVYVAETITITVAP